MSLLMDALKKAEQEKREAAKRVKESEELALKDRDQDLEQEPDQDQAGETAAETPPEEQQEPETAPPSAEEARKARSIELSLTPMDSGPNKLGARRGVSSDEQRAYRAGGDDSPTPPPQPPPDLALDDEEEQPGERSRDEPREPARATDHAGPAEEGPASAGQSEVEEAPGSIHRDPDETFHGYEMDVTDETVIRRDPDYAEAESEEISRIHDETLPGVPAAQLAADIGGQDLPTPVAAETIFTAGTTTEDSRGALLKWVLVTSAVVMVVAAGIWYYYTVTPINRELPSPMVARGIETIEPLTPQQRQQAAVVASPPPPVAAQAETGPDAVAPAAGPGQTPRPPEETPGPGQRAATTAGQPGRAGNDAAAARAGAAADTSPPSGGAPESDAGTAPATTPEAPAARPMAGNRGGLPEAIEPPRSLIRISRSVSPDERARRLRDAYAAYSSGDYETAAARYDRVLEDDPENRDALLGLAAIAVQRQEIQQAVRIYVRLLELNPRDNLARASLINLTNSPSAQAGESRIKLMLRDNPDMPYLHFALGNLYASQSRWPDAQQAFFDAYRLDSNSPDYAMNLAVSLDRLGKAEAALKYYRTARRLAADGGRPRGFDPESLNTRIRILEEALQP